MSTLQSPYNNTCLSGKVALITGGASGIGYFITEQLLRHGVETAILLGRRESFLQKSSQALSSQTGKQVLYQVCDVRNDAQCVNVIKWVMERTGGRLDILINAAAGNFLAVAEQLKPKGFKTVCVFNYFHSVLILVWFFFISFSYCDIYAYIHPHYFVRQY